MPLDAATIASTARGRNVAFTSCNIKSSWLKIGPYPFNPDRVLPLKDDLLPTPMAVGSLTLLRTELEQEIHVLDWPGEHQLQKLANVAENAFTDHALLFDKNRLLFK
jgi:hypothetical protein